MSNTKLTDECCGQNCCEHENLGQEVPVESISEIIRARVVEAGARYFSNDNISDFIKEGEQELLVEELTEKMEQVLRSMVIDIDNDHNTQDTARRVAKMYVNEIFSGRFVPAPAVTTFPNDSKYDQLYIVGPISITSHCAHHFGVISGHAYVGVCPGSKVIGLSKFHRIARWICSRPQIQEELTVNLANAYADATGATGLAVFIDSDHGCVKFRGVQDHDSRMITSEMRGTMRTDPVIRQEFFNLINRSK